MTENPAPGIRLIILLPEYVINKDEMMNMKGEKKMKKLVALLTTLILVVGLCACGGSSGGSSAAKSTSSAPAASSEAKSAPAAPSEAKSTSEAEKAEPASSASSAPAAEAPAETLSGISHDQITAPGPDCGECPAPLPEPRDWPDASGDKEVTLTIATQFANGNPIDGLLNHIAVDLYDRSGGTIKIEYYGASTLLSAADGLDGILNGIADITYMVASDYQGRFPELSFAEIPGMYFASAPAISHATREYIETYKPEELKDITVLTCLGGNVGVIGTNVGPIHNPSDLKGQTIRALGNMARAIQAFGGTPADVSIADCYESLRTGVLDGIMTIHGALEGFKLSEVLEYAIDYPLYNNMGFYVIANSALDRLSPAQKEILLGTWDEYNQTALCAYGSDDYTKATTIGAMDEVRAKGGIYNPTEEEIEEFRVLIEPIAQEYADELTSKGLNGDEIYGRWKELAAKWNEIYPNRPSEDNWRCTLPDGTPYCSDGHTWILPY